MGTFPPDQLGGLNSMTLHDMITIMIPQIGTLGINEIQYMEYTSEYIQKLQIHSEVSNLSHIGLCHYISFFNP